MSKRKKIVISLVTIILIILLSFVIYIRINPKVAVICYHNVATQEEKEKYSDEKDWIITVENFEEHLKYLQKHRI